MRSHEKPIFDCGVWTANTRHGLVWNLFKRDDPRATNVDGYSDAEEAVKVIIKTGQPLFGGWR